MKKNLIFKIVLSVFIFVGIFISCEKSEVEDCETCKSETYVKLNPKIGGTNFEFKAFLNKENNFNYLFNRFNENEF